MASAVITPDTKDPLSETPLLTVAVNKLSSSSPFPSPGSPFFPPPIPSAHEYAPIPPLLSKRRSTESRMMNVGSKTDHESTAPSDHLLDAPSIAAPSSPAEKTSSSASTLDKRGESESTNITSNGISNGLVVPTMNGQATTSTTAKSSHSTEPGGGPPLLSTEDTTLNAKQHTLSILDNDDAGGTSAPSPSTPLSSSQNPLAALPTTPPSFSSSFVVTAPATQTESAKLSSLDNNQNNSKSTSRNSLRSSRDSLASSRPAPPSPAGSRRASAALSRHSSTRSRPGSIASLTPANNYDVGEASPTTPTPTQSQAQQQGPQQQAAHRASSSSAVAAPGPASTPMVLVKIRDFAFPDEDVRHAGTGPLTPRPNRRLQRPLSTWSASSASSAGSGEGHDDGTSSAGGVGGPSSYGFSGWGLGRLSWFGARGSASAGAGAGTNVDATGGGPSERDFARNFTEAMSPEYEADDPYESLDDDDDDDDSGQYGGVEDENVGERVLLPGLYRALYAFEPEGTAEMALEEDQIVRVIGRGGGVGWAIVARGDDEGHALVPEGYLELISSDRDSEQVGEEGV